MILAQQLKELREFCSKRGYGEPTLELLSHGASLIRISSVSLGGWNRPECAVLFVAPPGYPAAQPDCFWAEPSGLRLAGGGTPQAANDSNPIPGETPGKRSLTWFSWHLQSWNPSRHSLTTYFGVILQRLKPAR